MSHNTPNRNKCNIRLQALNINLRTRDILFRFVQVPEILIIYNHAGCSYTYFLLSDPEVLKVTFSSSQILGYFISFQRFKMTTDQKTKQKNTIISFAQSTVSFCRFRFHRFQFKISLFAFGSLTAQGVRILIRPGNKEAFFSYCGSHVQTDAKNTVKYPTVLNEETNR